MDKTYDGMWMSILSRIALKDTSGKVDWAFYYPRLITRTLNSLRLPVGNTSGEPTFIRLVSGRAKGITSYESSRRFAGKLLIYALGSQQGSVDSNTGGESTMQQFEKLLQLLEDYYQPNVNTWFTKNITDFIWDLQHYFQMRLKRDIERQGQRTYRRSITDGERKAISTCLVKIALRGQSSTNKTLQKTCIDILHRNAYIVPELVFPSVLKRLTQSLGSASTVNYLSTSINSLAFCLRPLFRMELPPQAIEQLEI